MTIELSCTGCGGNNFAIDAAETDGSPVECRDCGQRAGTWSDIKSRILTSILRHEDPDDAPLDR